MSTLLWMNPKSRSGDQGHKAFVDSLETLGRVYHFKAGRDCQLDEVINDLGNQIERVIVGGGDGTIHYAMPAIIESGLPFGIIPLGTGNDFARSLGLPLDPIKAIEVIQQKHLMKVDMGKVNGKWFLNAAGVGLGPELTKVLDNESKRQLGVLAYLKSFFHVFDQLRSHRVKLLLDGKRVSTRFIQLTVANGIHYGGGMTVSREASLEDGRLRVLVIKPQSRWSLLRKAFTLRFGARKSKPEPELLVYEAESVDVLTRKSIEASVDGELETTTPLQCRCESVKILV